MPKLTFIEADGALRVVDVAPGRSIMEAAKSNGVRGILGDCGGCCICGTCHVYVDPAWQELIGPPSDIEVATMDFSENVQANSRLGCQITVTDAHDGLVLRIPVS